MNSNFSAMEAATANLDIAPNGATQSTDQSSSFRSSPPSSELSQSMVIDDDPFAVITNNAPNFRYKYPQAAPTPPGEDDMVWNKVFTAADSRLYNKHHKNANESRKYRESGETRILAIRMLQENKEKHARAIAAAKASGTFPASKSTLTMPKKPVPKVKKETSSSSRDGTPGGDFPVSMLSMAEKIKLEGRARKPPPAAPSSQGTPAPSVAPKQGTPSASGKQGTPFSGPQVNSTTPETSGSVPPPKVPKPAKKGTATTVKRPRSKKPKTEAEKATANENNASQSGSMNAVGSDSESNDGGEYCICRGPDDHRMMVYCDGGCEDWYHCSCVKINEDDTKELLDRFICPKCTQPGVLFTTWKRMCRSYNIPTKCRKAARVTLDPPSKYCSDECARDFWEFVRSKMRKDDAPSLGGALSVSEFGKLMGASKTASDFHKLGQKPRLPKKDGADPTRPAGLDYVNEEEQQKLDEIKRKMKLLRDRIAVFKNQHQLLILVNNRSKIAAQQPNLEVKDPCGFDNRLAMNEDEFDEWFNSAEGKLAFKTGILGPRTDETRHIGAHIPFPGQVLPTPPKVPDALDNICLKPKKKCRHGNWVQIHGTDFINSQRILLIELQKLKDAEDEIVEDAELREVMKEYYAGNETVQLF